MLGPLTRWFELFRWAAVVFLIYLSLTQFFGRPKNLSSNHTEADSARTLFLRGFFVSLGNPKTLFFCPVFFPRFIAPDSAWFSSFRAWASRLFSSPSSSIASELPWPVPPNAS